MQSVYLLLRSNQQSGPYTLDELVAFNLKPIDLIWIEGRSAGWYYPQEIQALHPYLSFLQQKTEAPQAVANPTTTIAASPLSKKVFVAMPTTARPSLSQQATSQPVAAPPTTPPEAELKTTYTKPLEQAETEYMNWVYEKKRKQPASFPKKAALAACLLGVAAVAGWWMMKDFDAVVMQTATPTPAQSVSGEMVADPLADEPVQTSTATPTVSKKQTAIKNSAAQKRSEQARQPVQEAMVTAPAPTEPKASAPVTEEEVATTTETASEPAATEAPAKKKKLRDKILDLFKKKPEEAKPVEEANGERQSTRRETGANLVQLVAVRFTVPNDWMMGIKGAKATLTNRSSETVATASVEVVYYNDDNEVLTKRTIAFHNIKSKGTATVFIPDHATATRLEYQVLSAVGAGEPLASR